LSRRLIRRVPGARALRRAIDRLRTPPAIREELDALRQSTRRLDRELSEARELLLANLEGPPILDESAQIAAYEQDPTPMGPRRVLCSLGIGGHSELLRVSSVTFEAYAVRYGYDLVLSRHWLVPERPPSWSKVALVRTLLDHYDEVLWIDADAIFVDISEDIAGLVTPEKDLYLVEHTWEGGRRRSANLGVFLIRSTDWSRRLLDSIWTADRYIDHRWWENAALLDMLGYELPTDGSRPRKVKRTELQERVELIGVEWNSLGSDTHGTPPRIRHHGRHPLPELRRRLLADLVTFRTNSG
jgi:hypothetical protein